PDVSLDSPPGAMDMVRGVLGAVGLNIKELNGKCRSVYPVGSALARLQATGEREVNGVEAGVLGELPFHGGNVRRHAVGVTGHELEKRAFLLFGHLPGDKTDGRTKRGRCSAFLRPGDVL